MAYGKTKMGKKLNPTTESVNADRDRDGRPLNPRPSKANTKEVYNPKTRVTTLVNKKTGKTFAASMPGPKFQPKLTKGAR
jgi:hypothetical protein